MNSRMSNKELNALSPIIDVISSIVSLNQQNENISNDFKYSIMSSFSNDIKYCFKVLILDDSSFLFISSLLKQSSLTKNNICLTLKLNEQKTPMPDVMAIYMITPTSSNFKLILKDMQNDIYENYSINFIEKPDDSLFEDFLASIIKLDKYDKINNVHVFPIKYSIIHPKVIDFCSMDNKIKRPYSNLNLNQNSQEMENYYDLISNMLFNALFSMRVSPLIKCRKGSFVEIIVNKIQNKFLSTFYKFPKLRKEFQNSNLIMVILERELLDIPIMFHHPASFGAMINDVCGMTFTEDKNKKKFQIDPINDFIWNNSLNKPYYEVGEETFLEFKKFEQEMKILGNTTKSNNIEELSEEAEKLSDKIKNIEYKKIEQNILTKHGNFYVTISKNAEYKKLGEIHLIEVLLLGKREITDEINQKLLDFKTQGNINFDNSLDILRLCLIYFILDKDNTNSKFVLDIINNLSVPSPYNVKALINFFDIIKNGEKGHSSKDILSKLKEPEPQTSTMLGHVGGVTKNLFKKGFNFIKNSVSSFIATNKTSIAANIVEGCVYGGKNIEQDFWEFQINSEIIIPIRSCVYQNVFLFTLGGGSLNEFELCEEHLKQYNINLIYGADKIYSPLEFLEEINEFALSQFHQTNNKQKK